MLRQLRIATETEIIYDVILIGMIFTGIFSIARVWINSRRQKKRIMKEQQQIEELQEKRKKAKSPEKHF